MRLKYILVAATLLLSGICHSQTSAIDSLYRQLQRAAGAKDSIMILTALGRNQDLIQCPHSDSVSKTHLKTALSISERVGSLRDQLYLRILLTPAPAQPALVDSPIIRLKGIITEAHQLKLSDVEAFAHVRLGHLYIFKDSKLAQLELNKAISIYSGLGEHLGKARAQTALANVFLKTEYFENSIIYSQRAIAEYKVSPASPERDHYLGYTYLLMGYCNQATNNPTEEEHWYKLAEPLISKAVAYKIRFILYTYWGRMKIKQGLYTDAVSKYRNALDVCTASGNRSEMATCLYDIANAYLYLKQKSLAASTIEQATTITNGITDPFARGKNFGHIAEIKFALGMYDQAIYYGNKALADSRIGNFMNIRLDMYHLLRDINRKKGDYAAAYKYLDSATGMQIEQLKTDKKNELATAQQRMETRWTESALKAKNEKLNMLQEQSRLNNRLFLLVVLLVLAVAAFVILAVNRSRLIARKEMEEQLKEEQRKNALSAIKAHEEERQMIARELHDGVGAYLSALKLNFNKLRETIDAPALPDIERSLDRLSQEIRTISENLVSATLRDYGLAIATEELAELISQAGKVQVTTHFDENTDSIPDELALTSFRIIQELTNNALKHSNASQISISAGIDDKHLIIVVSDNGSESLRSGDSQGTGLKNITNRLSIYNGNIILRPAAGSGTQAQISIPLTNV
jgi:signal transduction histidine kinase